MRPGKYPCGALSPSWLLLSNSAANSCRSCHRALPNANLNLFYFTQSFCFSESRWLVATAAVDFAPLPARCAIGSWGELRPLQIPAWLRGAPKKHHLFSITSTYHKQTHMLRIKRATFFCTFIFVCTCTAGCSVYTVKTLSYGPAAEDEEFFSLLPFSHSN